MSRPWIGVISAFDYGADNSLTPTTYMISENQYINVNVSNTINGKEKLIVEITQKDEYLYLQAFMLKLAVMI